MLIQRIISDLKSAFMIVAVMYFFMSPISKYKPDRHSIKVKIQFSILTQKLKRKACFYALQRNNILWIKSMFLTLRDYFLLMKSFGQ